MNCLKVLIGVSLICSIGCKVPQNDNVLDKESESTVDVFFKKIEVGDYKSAIENLLRQNENIDLKDSSTIALIEKFNYINGVSGKYRGYQLLKKRLVNSDVGMYSYLVKYDSKFYRFMFEFYNNGSGGKIYKFKFDDTLDLEMEESLKLYTAN